MSLCDKSRDLIESYGNGSVLEHWCQFDSISTVAHQVVGSLLVFICVLSILGNLLVVVVFSKYRRLRSPASTLIVNLAVSDMLNGFLHPMAAYSAFKESWMFERIGCEMYAGCCGLFGLVSIVTLTAIAVERCMVISVKPLYGGNLFTNTKAKMAIVFIWIYCLLLMVPPLFGWGAFVPEGFLTSCSFDYLTRDAANRSYFICIFIFGFFLPVLVIVVCYSFIMKTILQNEKEMKKNNIKKLYNKPKKRNDYKAAEMIMFVILMFLLSWIPYSLIACIGQFGNKSTLTPWVSVLPSLFAKMSTIYNPAIYGLSHRHFRATIRRLLKRKTPSSAGDRGMTYSSRNSSLTRTRNGCPCLPNYGTSDILEDSSSSMAGQKMFFRLQTFDSNRIIYVRKPQPGASERSNYSVKYRDSYRPDNNSTTVQQVAGAVLGDLPVRALTKNLMFRSEFSIHQKYQILVEEDQITKIPTVIYFRHKRKSIVKALGSSTTQL